MVKFLHTSDWQLGMTRYFLSEGAQERFTQARFDAIRTLGKIAREEGCQFMLVCGDAFESNQVDRKTVARSLEALKDVHVPVFILPGNHDPLNAGSVYRSSTFIEHKPAHVKIIENSVPITLDDKVELVGAPWMSKRPIVNPIETLLSALSPTRETTRICMGHGAVDRFTPDREAADVVAVATLESAIAESKVHFIVLGDRHSLTKVGDRVWYSGTPEVTDFAETQSGYAQIVELDGSQVVTRDVQVGQWRFIERDRVDLNTTEDVEELQKSLDDILNKECTVVRLNIVGSISLSLRSVLQTHLDSAKDLFAALDVREDELLVLTDDADFSEFRFSGFADAIVRRFRTKIVERGDEGGLARDALMLLLRLARSKK